VIFLGNVRRIFVEKKKSFDVEAEGLFHDLCHSLALDELKSVKIINRYDVEGISKEDWEISINTIFSEPPVDHVYIDIYNAPKGSRFFAIEYLPGQYDQRADSAVQCVQLIAASAAPVIRTAKLIVLEGNISDNNFEKIKEYCINPVESREAALEKPESLEVELVIPDDVKEIDGFITMDEAGIDKLMSEMGFAMSKEDLLFCREYFKNEEKRNPTITEIRMIDTYWSDHCRHTTFLTEIQTVEFEEGKYTETIKKAYETYLSARKEVYGSRNKPVCLMDIATIGMKELKRRGLLEDLDISDEINACSIVVEADVNGKKEEWLVMFKNETHNHPTEIEPFGGAATCLGGAIRDPLSGRSYVYQAMRVTGSGDPRTPIDQTLPGKLPQKKITTGAASGYSSYGNQIGLATGQVEELYDEGYIAKRMEIGAVIGAAPKRNIVRKMPEAGDAIILLGGRTGRDGCGGATGSSKEHTEESLLTCGAEVQKGNPPTERKIQRLFRNEKVSTLIKKCNDFGAGGVSVAIGELADGLLVNLDAVPKKYEGLDGTELAISESQERMAVVVDKSDVDAIINYAHEENLEAVLVAEVLSEPRLKMVWRSKLIVDISREFLNTNGVTQTISVKVSAPDSDRDYFKEISAELRGDREFEDKSLKSKWIKNLKRLEVCARKGLVERFDSTIGAGSILLPFGGVNQMTPTEGMAAKLPVLEGDTNTATLMTFGFNPQIGKWSPFHGAVTAVLESLAKIAALGGNVEKARLTLQEYFEKPGRDAVRWGKPFAALLGAYYVQSIMGTAAIGGKDSMSGTFKDMDVPPTLVSFAVATSEADKVVSNEFKKAGSTVVLLELPYDEVSMPNFEVFKKNCSLIYELATIGNLTENNGSPRILLSAQTLKGGGIAEAISKMAFGNSIGFEFESIEVEHLYKPLYGSFILEIDGNADITKTLNGVSFEILGKTINKKVINLKKVVTSVSVLSEHEIDKNSDKLEISLKEAMDAWLEPLEEIFPTKADTISHKADLFEYKTSTPSLKKSNSTVAKPRVIIPVFPGTNTEYDTAKVFEKAGAIAETIVIKNLTSKDINDTVNKIVKSINNAQIVMLPGGFSAGDEPEGSGKFIATFFRNPAVSEAVMNMLNNRDGLMLGICNGFQALIKLGLLPYGEIREITSDCPTLTFNSIGRHVSCMVNTKITSNNSPWLSKVQLGDVHTIAVSHGEGRFYADESVINKLAEAGQIATQYVDLEGNPSTLTAYNPNGSIHAIEGIISPDGRILGKMGHSERIGTNVAINVPGSKDQKLFEAGVEYFR
jgi:phosphoribosylformylglycinamidine synthase